jgi:hypothetical protein
MARARVAEPGQRRWLEGPVSKEFLGSNPIPRIRTVSHKPLQNLVIPGRCALYIAGTILHPWFSAA